MLITYFTDTMNINSYIDDNENFSFCGLMFTKHWRGTRIHKCFGFYIPSSGYLDFILMVTKVS